MKKIVVFTGAGVSADSGLATFRDSDGLWASYRIEDVCTPEALAHNRATVIGFYNMRRREMLAAQPNAGHEAIAGLERDFEVEVLTQNVDDLHERAGSSKVTHLHGELTCLRSSRNPDLVVPIEGWEQKLDATAPDGALLRPHIVFFGEAVPMFERAAQIAQTADIMVVVGTSLAVYPAASLVRCVRPEIPIYVVDPGNPDTAGIRNPLTLIRKRAAEGHARPGGAVAGKVCGGVGTPAFRAGLFARISRPLIASAFCSRIFSLHFAPVFRTGILLPDFVPAFRVGLFARLLLRYFAPGFHPGSFCRRISLRRFAAPRLAVLAL